MITVCYFDGAEYSYRQFELGEMPPLVKKAADIALASWAKMLNGEHFARELYLHPGKRLTFWTGNCRSRTGTWKEERFL
jgi:hypothetical protein